MKQHILSCALLCASFLPLAAMPMLDVSADASRQVTVDREPGQYLGHPTTALLPDGRTIFAVYPKGHAKGALVLKKSEDGGLTWSERLPVPENWETSVNPPSINYMVDPQGVGRLIVLTGSRENGKEDYPVRISVSEDLGETWTPLERIGEGRDYNAIVVASAMMPLKDGSYMALQHSSFRGNDTEPRKRAIYKMLSKDGGLTWSPREFVTDLEGARLCEPGAARSPDGSEIAVIMRENTRKQNSFIVFSEDEGESWGELTELDAYLTGDKHVAKYAPDGRLVIVFRDVVKGSPTRGQFIAWVGTYEDLKNGGKGQYRVKLLSNHSRLDCGYAGLELLPDGTFVATTYTNDRPGEKHAVVSVRFRLEEFDAMLRKRK